MSTLDPEFTCGGALRPQIARDHCLRQEAKFLQEFAHQFPRRGLIPFGLDQHVQNLFFTISRSQNIDQASVDLQIDFLDPVWCATSTDVCEVPPRSWIQCG